MNATPPKPPFAVVGLGRLGLALSRALGRAYPEAPLVAIEADPRARAQALQDRLVGEAHEAPGPFLSACGLVFLCVPLGSLHDELLEALGAHLAPTAILTDTMVVKGEVDARIRRVLPDVRYVGGHPLVGGEPTNTKPDLFAGRPVVLCPREGEESLAAGVGTVWASLGARPVVLPAEEHDRLVAATIHAPYLSAVALSRIAAASEGAERVVGKSFSEALRLAGVSPDVMASAVAANPFAARAARVLADELRRLADLAEEDPEKLLEVARDARAARSRLLPE